MDKPNYYSVIPAKIRYDEDLRANEKLLYGEISALSNKYGYCVAGNTYFAELYKVHKKTISEWISHLKSKGYIETELIYEDKKIVERRIYIETKRVNAKVRNTYPSKYGYPIHRNTDTLSIKRRKIILQVLIIKKKKKEIFKMSLKILLIFIRII